jgi:hypothetical protein
MALVMPEISGVIEFQHHRALSISAGEFAVVSGADALRHARTFSGDLAEYSPGLKLIFQSFPYFAGTFQIGLRFLRLL